jgi:hypothetical protein
MSRIIIPLQDRLHLFFDIDETLVHTVKKDSDLLKHINPDHTLAFHDYIIIFRPGLDYLFEYLAYNTKSTRNENNTIVYTINLWSCGRRDYVDHIAKYLVKRYGIEIHRVYDNCDTDSSYHKYKTAKSIQYLRETFKYKHYILIDNEPIHGRDKQDNFIQAPEFRLERYQQEKLWNIPLLLAQEIYDYHMRTL